MNVTWDDLAQRMADTTGRATTDPSVVEAIDALKATKLKPAFVLAEWNARAGGGTP